MSGTTAHGIRHPDGSTKAKNLGPELETFADDVDRLLFEQVGGIIDPIVRDVVIAAVNLYLSQLDVVPLKSAHFEAGQLILDPPGGPLATHYMLPDHDGGLVAHRTAWPKPTGIGTYTW